MDWLRLPRRVRLLLPTGLALVMMAVAGCAGPAPDQANPDLGPLQQTVTAQGTRLAAVEQQVSELQTAVAQAKVDADPHRAPGHAHAGAGGDRHPD